MADFGSITPEYAQRLHDAGLMTADQLAAYQPLPTAPPISNLGSVLTGPAPQPIAPPTPISPMASANRATPAQLDQAAATFPRAYDVQPPMAPPTGAPGDQMGGAAPMLASDVPVQTIGPSSRPLFNAMTAEGMTQALAGKKVEQGVLTAAGVAAEKQGVDTQRAYEQMANENLLQRQTDEMLNADRNRQLDSAHKQLDADVLALSQQKLDPNRFWANKSTGEKILAGIGLFVGAFGGKGGNPAIGIINDAINRDLDAQKADMAAKDSSLKTRKGLLADMTDRYKDESAGRSAARVAGLNDALLKVKGMEARYAGVQAKANAAKLAGQLESEIGLEKAKFGEFIDAKVQAQQVGQFGGVEGLPKDMRERYVPGLGLALTKEDATDLKKSVGETQSVKGTINELLDLSKMAGKAVDLNARAKAQTLSSMLQGQLRTQVLGPGAVTDNERKLLEQIIADPTAIFSLDSTNRTTLQTLMGTIERNFQSKVKGYGLAQPTLADRAPSLKSKEQ